jgi:hypothetical protein
MIVVVLSAAKIAIDSGLRPLGRCQLPDEGFAMGVSVDDRKKAPLNLGVAMKTAG